MTYCQVPQKARQRKGGAVPQIALLWSPGVVTVQSMSEIHALFVAPPTTVPILEEQA